MKLSVATFAAALLLLPPLAGAGVVMEMVTRNASGQEMDRMKIYAQSKKIRMDISDEGASDGMMIFRDNELIYANHSDKSYIVMDEAMLEEVSAQVSDAMKEMEKQLAGMPPEQRAMVEQMMKGRMEGMMAKQSDAPPALRVESMGSSEWQSYDCRQYAIFQGSQKTQQVCAADLDDVDGADEAMEAFRHMAAYLQKMTESMPMMGEKQPNPIELMDQIDGFPVLTIDYDDGVAASETSLDSVSEESLDENMFTVPEGYRRQDPFGGR